MQSNNKEIFSKSSNSSKYLAHNVNWHAILSLTLFYIILCETKMCSCCILLVVVVIVNE